MKKKLLLITLMIMLLACIFVISVSAEELKYYCDIEITLVDGTKTTGYCSIDTSSKRLQRDTIYKTPDTTSETISWTNIEIFDARNTTIVGGLDPVSVAGLGCNSYATNVKEFYFPPTTTSVLDSSFTSGWSSLEKVWIPKSVETINYKSFYQSAVKAVVIEEGSKLEIIHQEAFRECSRLQSINLQEGLKTIDYCAFYITNLNGTFVVPNSVNLIGDGAFRKTKIETLVLGDGAVSLGYNLVGDDTINTYLKKVYIPVEATFSGTTSQIWYETANTTVEIYVIAKEGQDTSSFVQALKSTGRLKFATEAEIEAGATGYNAIIKLGYNKCDAFYGKEHQTNSPVYTFTSFTEGAKYIATCTTCNAQEATKTLEPIIKILGYSAKINGDKLCVGYKLNEEAISEYYNATGKKLDFGVVAIVPIDESELNPLYVENSEVKSIDYTITASFKYNYASFDFVVSGFDANSYSKDLVMCAYVFDGEYIKYICSDVASDTATTFKYSDKATA